MEDLAGSRVYCCLKCRNIVALHDDIVDKNFLSGHSRAFLFSHSINTFKGPTEDRQLITGVHMVADVYCSDCKEMLGWKYEKTYHEEHKYKLGKTVITMTKITKKAEEHPFY